MKQETPEEAAERIYPMVGNEYLWHVPIQTRKIFIEGAKWQQERSYSEEEVYSLLCSMPNFYKMTIPQQIKARNEWFKQFKK